MAKKGKTRRVILGNSHAGLSALEMIYKHDPEALTTTIISRERGFSYSPTSLPALIAGEIAEEKLILRNHAFYDRMNARTLLGANVKSLDIKNKEVIFADGGRIVYDQLLIATGSSPAVPPISGLKKDVTYTLRTLQDAKQIMAKAKSGKKVVVYGGGLVGMEVASALHRLGLAVTVIVRSRVLRIYFDSDMASIIEDIYRDKGIEILKGCEIASVEKRDRGMKLFLKPEGEIDADFVVVATGVKANMDFLAHSGIEVGNGVLVNEKMQTSDPSIYAAGDVAEGKGFFREERIMPATLPHAVSQGKVAGANMAGGNEEFMGGINMNIFNFFSNTAFSVGMSLENGKGFKVFKEIDRVNRKAKKLVLRDDKVVGCSMINQEVEAGLLREMIVRGWMADKVIRHFEDDFPNAVRATLIRERGREIDEKRRRN